VQAYSSCSAYECATCCALLLARRSTASLIRPSHVPTGHISVLYDTVAITARFLNRGAYARAYRFVWKEMVPTSQAIDRVFLSRLPRKKLLDLMYFQIRNIWRVDGLYFLGIEKDFGIEAASKIDQECWKIMGTLEAHQLKEILPVKQWSIPKIMEALRFTSWALDQQHKKVVVQKDRAVFRVASCSTQLTRLKKGLTEFPCRPVREGYLKAFAKELNPSVEVTCKVCPPSPHSDETWCEWEFTKPQ